jgi:hypothetical protein
MQIQVDHNKVCGRGARLVQLYGNGISVLQGTNLVLTMPFILLFSKGINCKQISTTMSHGLPTWPGSM